MRGGGGARRRSVILGFAAFPALALGPGQAFEAQAQTAPALAGPPAAHASVAPSSETKVGALEEARSAIAKSLGAADFPALLEASAKTLPPQDAYLLLVEYTPTIVEAAARAALLARAGDLAFLLGRFADAAALYEQSAAANPAAQPGGKSQALLLKAARCSLAAGDTDRASRAAASVLIDPGCEDNRVAALLVGAWTKVIERRDAEAALILDSLRGSGSQAALKPEARRELLLLAWLIAPEEKKAAEVSALAKEFPQSSETAIASGMSQPPALPHWYLSFILPSALPPPEAPKPPAAVQGAKPAAAPVDAPAAAQDGAASAGQRFQVGYFSLEENAKRLQAELAAKGFTATTETRPATGSGKDSSRWAVIVEGGSDSQTTGLKLKDSGYEFYPVD